jgi:hypothetical protein
MESSTVMLAEERFAWCVVVRVKQRVNLGEDDRKRGR